MALVDILIYSSFACERCIHLLPVLQPKTRYIVNRNRTIYHVVLKSKTIYRIGHKTDLSRGDSAKCIRQYHRILPDAVHAATTMRVNTEKESISMIWGFGHGLWFLLPLFFLGKFF